MAFYQNPYRRAMSALGHGASPGRRPRASILGFFLFLPPWRPIGSWARGRTPHTAIFGRGINLGLTRFEPPRFFHFKVSIVIKYEYWFTSGQDNPTLRAEKKMAKELEGKVAAVTGGAAGIGLASTEAMLAAGARVVLVDRDEAALTALREKHGDAVIALVIALLDAKSCATLMPQILEKAGQLDILHANAGIYIGGDLVDANTDAIDRMLNLNVNVVMKNVHDVLPHMIERATGDIVVTSSLAAHFPTPWEPVYASSKWAINCFVQTVRRQVFKHGTRVGSISPGPVISALLADWPEEKLKEAKESGSLIEASEVANVVMFMLTRPRGVTIPTWSCCPPILTSSLSLRPEIAKNEASFRRLYMCSRGLICRCLLPTICGSPPAMRRSHFLENTRIRRNRCNPDPG